MRTLHKSLPFAISGLAGKVGAIVPIDAFAKTLQIPDRKSPGNFLPGAFLRDLLGLVSKSWDPKLFSQVETLSDTAYQAMQMAGVTASDVDALVIVTCTPLWLNLDQDAFAIAQALRLSQHATVLQLHAGCAGLPRVLNALADWPYRNVVALFYNLASPLMTDACGRLNPLYAAPDATRWFSAALFADGVSAAVFSRREALPSKVCYARESGNPLIHYRGGGVHQPPGRMKSESEMVYEIATGAAAAYYREGMACNFHDLSTSAPAWEREVAAYYIHQTSTAAVREHYQLFQTPIERQHCHADRYGNLSSAATLLMAHEDFRAGKISENCEIAVSAVGAGPERGCAILSLRLGGGR